MQNWSINFRNRDIALKCSYQKITHGESVNNRLTSLMSKNSISRTSSYEFKARDLILTLLSRDREFVTNKFIDIFLWGIVFLNYLFQSELALDLIKGTDENLCPTGPSTLLLKVLS